MKKLALAVAVLAVFAVALLNPGEALAASSFPYPVLKFNDAAQQIELIIPTPACPAGTKGCEWTLYVNEPNAPGMPFVASVSGTSGMLVIPYPKICAVLQADALITIQADALLGTGGTPTYVRGIRHQVLNCASDPGGVPGTVIGESQLPNTGTTGTSGTGGAGGTQATTTALTSTDPASAAQLPFTGIDVRGLLFSGSALVMAGILLITTGRSRRRALQKAAAVRPAHVKEGARRTGLWFLGL